MTDFMVHPIGMVHNNENGMFIEIDRPFIPALQALNGFGYINVLWWFSMCDNGTDRNVLQIESPYRNSPVVMGVFATRSPQRPNPIAQTAVQVLHIDYEQGRIFVPFIDAIDGTPVLDIKPYTPSFDRVERPKCPDWCQSWPMSTEQSGEFDWQQVFNF